MQPPLPTFVAPADRSKFELAGRDQSVQDSNDFRSEFIVSGKDIHSLPDVFISTQLINDGSLAKALARSSAVVLATVVGQSAQVDGYVASTVRVDESIDRSIGVQQVVVVQNGGPVLTSDGAALAQDDQSPILRPGRQYLLFARPGGPTTDGKYTAPLAIGGAGNIYEVTGGRLEALGAPEGMKTELGGLTLADAESRVGVALAASPKRAGR